MNRGDGARAYSQRSFSSLNGIDLVVPKRTTFYGTTEIGVREPGGNLIIFAMQGQGEGVDV